MFTSLMTAEQDVKDRDFNDIWQEAGYTSESSVTKKQALQVAEQLAEVAEVYGRIPKRLKDELAGITKEHGLAVRHLTKERQRWIWADKHLSQVVRNDNGTIRIEWWKDEVLIIDLVNQYQSLVEAIDAAIEAAGKERRKYE